MNIYKLFDFKPYRPLGNLTKPWMVSINNTTGQLKVIGVIQCDVPKIYELLYEVIITDGVYETKGKVLIV